MASEPLERGHAIGFDPPSRGRQGLGFERRPDFPNRLGRILNSLRVDARWRWRTDPVLALLGRCLVSQRLAGEPSVFRLWQLPATIQDL